MGALVTGDRAIDKKLAALADQQKLIKKIVRPAIAAGLRVAAKAMKAAVPANMKDAKKSIGSRFGKSQRTGTVMAKAGAAVGMKKAQRARINARVASKREGHPGVGIGPSNVMWFILGTEERETGSKRVRSKGVAPGTRTPTGSAVHSTGRMPSQMNPIKQGFLSSQTAVMEKIMDVSRKKLAELVK